MLVIQFIKFADRGWKKVDPWPFYKAPNGPFGRLIGFLHSIPSAVYLIHDWLHIEKGVSNIMILTIMLSVPVILGLAMICLMDYIESHSLRMVGRPHVD